MNHSNIESSNEQQIDELARQLKKEQNRAYYERNKARLLKKQREKRIENLDAARQKEREYRAANADRVKTWQENYWKRQAAKQLEKNKEA